MKMFLTSIIIITALKLLVMLYFLLLRGKMLSAFSQRGDTRDFALVEANWFADMRYRKVIYRSSTIIFVVAWGVLSLPLISLCGIGSLVTFVNTADGSNTYALLYGVIEVTKHNFTLWILTILLTSFVMGITVIMMCRTFDIEDRIQELNGARRALGTVRIMPRFSFLAKIRNALRRTLRKN